MKRTLVLIIISFLIVLSGTRFAEEVDLKKVNRFIKEMGEAIEENFDIFGWDSTMKDRISKIMNGINLNDDESLEVQRIIAEQIDVKAYGTMKISSEEFRQEDLVKYLIFHQTVYYMTERWRNTLTPKQIILDKIIPIIKTVNDELKAEWILLISLNDFTDYLYDKNLSYAKEMRIEVLDELIKIFSDKNNSIDVRYNAAYEWAPMEERIEKKYEGFDILLKDEEVFEKMGTFLRFLHKDDSPVPKVYEKLFEILENANKYSEKIITGTIEFFRRDTMQLIDIEKQRSYWTDEQIKTKDRLKKILNEASTNEKEEGKKEKYKMLLMDIERREKQGGYK